MQRHFSYAVDDREAGLTVEQFLKKRGYSRQVLVHLKKTEDGILLDGVWAYTRDRVRAGSRLDILLSEDGGSEQIEPVPLPFDIVYEDEDLMVVNKPADMPVHPSMNNHDNTLANAVAWHCRQKGERFPYRCINRLDRNTTGLLIIAKHMLSAAVLYGQMRERKIHRTYLALVKGRLEKPGVICLPIGRKEGSAIERTVDMEHGERAVTHYRPLERGENWTLVQCDLETGRTHQIRVHMSHIGHPLPGDFLYCPGDHTMERQPLHSWKLSFAHPITGERMEFEQPLPKDMTDYMNNHGGKEIMMKFQMIHENYNVADLAKSEAFYEKALGLKECRRKEAEDGSFIIVYLKNEESDFELELTWLRDMDRPYDLGDCEFHLAFRVDDYDAAYALHKEMGCICFENPSMGIYFIQDPDGYWLEIVPSR